MISKADFTAEGVDGGRGREAPSGRGEERAGGRPERVVGLLPVLDEVATIRAVVESVLSSGCVERLLVVDDFSTDGTLQELEAARSRYPQMDVVIRRHERGLGTALQFGFEEALRRYAFDRLVVLDADMSHDPKVIPRLLSAHADLVIGSRYAPGGRIENWPASRQVISLLANSAARWLLGLPVRDVTSGFRIYSRRAVQVMAEEAACGGYEFQVEVVWLATRHGFTINEAPIAFVERKAGKSKLRTWGEMGRFLRFVLEKSILRTLPGKGGDSLAHIDRVA